MRMNLAFASALSLAAGLGSSLGFAPPRRAVNFNPHNGSPRKAPFSSMRQHNRHARTQTTKVVNGFELMQTRPSHERF
jgi:hypothetical protein